MLTLDKIVCEAKLFEMILKGDKNTACFQATLKTTFAKVATSHLASGNHLCIQPMSTFSVIPRKELHKVLTSVAYSIALGARNEPGKIYLKLLGLI